MKHHPVKLDDLLEAFEFVSAGQLSEMEAYLCLETGVIHFHSDYGSFEQELPEDIDSERYVAVPGKTDLDLGRRVALKFAELELGDDFSDVYDIFRRKGAYPRFKDLLERRGKLQRWYDYEESRKREALREWCADNEIPIAKGGDVRTEHHGA